MIATTIEWHNSADELPAKSGKYLAVYSIYRSSPSIMAMQYSSKHKRFNADDWEDKPETAIDVIYWAELPEFPDTESEGE